MAPRALAEGGLRGPAQDRFPAAAKETGRNRGLTGSATVYKNEPVDDGGGASTPNWVILAQFRAGIDEISTVAPAGLVAEQINEASTHIISFDPGVPVTTDHRVEIEGRMWTLTAKQDFTDALIDRFEAREVIG